MGQDNLACSIRAEESWQRCAVHEPVRNRMDRFGQATTAKDGGSNRHVGVCIAAPTGHELAEPASCPELQQKDTAICAVSTSSHQWVAPPLHIKGDIFQP
jgi:hypothetical protein